MFVDKPTKDEQILKQFHDINVVLTKMAELMKKHDAEIVKLKETIKTMRYWD